MADSRAIQTAIQKMAGKFKDDPVKLIWGDVVSVELDNTDLGASSCTVRIKNDVELPNVALQTAFSDGLLLVPGIDSTVAIIKSVNAPYAMILKTSDLDKIYLQVDGAWLVIWGGDGEDSKFTLSSFGGLVKIIDPSDPTAGLLAKINRLEKNLTDLAKYVGSLPIPVSGAVSGPANSAATLPFQIITPTQKSDIENPLITHGK